MTNETDERVLTLIEHDLLRELHKHSRVILRVLEQEISKAEFSVFRYKDEPECYEQMIKLKQARNVLKSFLHVTK